MGPRGARVLVLRRDAPAAVAVDAGETTTLARVGDGFEGGASWS